MLPDGFKHLIEAGGRWVGCVPWSDDNGPRFLRTPGGGSPEWCAVRSGTFTDYFGRGCGFAGGLSGSVRELRVSTARACLCICVSEQRS